MANPSLSKHGLLTAHAAMRTTTCMTAKKSDQAHIRTRKAHNYKHLEGSSEVLSGLASPLAGFVSMNDSNSSRGRLSSLLCSSTFLASIFFEYNSCSHPRTWTVARFVCTAISLQSRTWKHEGPLLLATSSGTCTPAESQS